MSKMLLLSVFVMSLLLSFQNCSSSSSGGKKQTPNSQGNNGEIAETPLKYTKVNTCNYTRKMSTARLSLIDCPSNPLPESNQDYSIIGKKLYYGGVEIFGVNACEVRFYPNSRRFEYFTDSKYVYHNDSKIEGADPASFVVVDDSYAKDKNHVYINSHIVSDDVTNFIKIANGLYKDSHDIYNEQGASRNQKIDFSTFVYLGNDIYKDKSGYYSFNIYIPVNLQNQISVHGPYLNDGTAIFYRNFKTNIPVSEFVYLTGGFARSAKSLYSAGVEVSYKIDFATLQFGKNYFKDKDHVYNQHMIKRIDLDSSTFEEVVCFNESYQYDVYFFKDAKSVYFNGSKIENADPETFAIMSDNYSKDQFNVYLYDGFIIENADPITAVALDFQSNYFKDKNNVYLNYSVLPSADPNTFEEISQTYYARDRNFVYLNGEKIENADPKSLQVYNYEIAKDKNHVYNLNRSAESEADPASYQYINSSAFYDKNYFFVGGKKYPVADYLPITFLGADFIKTKKGIILNYNGELINFSTPPDLNSIVLIPGINLLKDINNVYDYKGRIVSSDAAHFEWVRSSWGLFAKDSTNVYNQYYNIISGISPANFRPLDVENVITDGAKLYYYSYTSNSKTEFVGANPNTFKVVGYYSPVIYSDGVSVYRGTTKITESILNPASLNYFGGIVYNLTVDNTQFYCEGKPVTGINLKENYYFDGYYIISPSKVYSVNGCFALSNVDMPTLSSLGNGVLKDKNKVYCSGQNDCAIELGAIKPDTSLHLLGPSFNSHVYVDQSHVYCGNLNGRWSSFLLEKDIDFNSFSNCGNKSEIFRDKNYVYTYSQFSGDCLNIYKDEKSNPVAPDAYCH